MVKTSTTSVVISLKNYYKNSSGEYERDSMGRLKKTDISDEEVKNRRNYQHNYAINHLDGDSASQASYEYGVTTLISDKSKVFKGGSWNDRAYWLSPGARRFLEARPVFKYYWFQVCTNLHGCSGRSRL